MLEILGGGIFGSLLGGIFRLAPEVLKWLDKKNERSHELEMFKNQCQLEAQRGSQKLDEIGAYRDMATDTGVLTAFSNAITQQSEMVKAAGPGWIASLSASVRPIITYWIIFIWSFVHIWFCWNSYINGLPPIEVFKTLLTPDLSALVAGTINYWFLDRSLMKRGL
jgi:hypothetical protein